MGQARKEKPKYTSNKSQAKRAIRIRANFELLKKLENV